MLDKVNFLKTREEICLFKKGETCRQFDSGE